MCQHYHRCLVLSWGWVLGVDAAEISQLEKTPFLRLIKGKRGRRSGGGGSRVEALVFGEEGWASPRSRRT